MSPQFLILFQGSYSALVAHSIETGNFMHLTLTNRCYDDETQQEKGEKCTPSEFRIAWRSFISETKLNITLRIINRPPHLPITAPPSLHSLNMIMASQFIRNGIRSKTIAFVLPQIIFAFHWIIIRFSFMPVLQILQRIAATFIQEYIRFTLSCWMLVI